MATKHKVTALRSGSDAVMGDWEAEYEITFSYTPGRPAVMYLRNGDPGYPADDPEIEFVSISPGAGDHGAFSDLAQKWLEEWASDWLQCDGYDKAMEAVASDSDVAADYAAEAGVPLGSKAVVS